MATWAIGDIQGCHDELVRLIEKIKFDPAQDKLWFCGDLVNRGGQSVAVLRYVKAFGDRGRRRVPPPRAHQFSVCGSAKRKGAIVASKVEPSSRCMR